MTPQGGWWGLALGLAVTVVASPGCVFKGKHELLEVQLDATRITMAARAEQCLTDIRDLEEQVEDLTLEIVLRQVQLDELGVRTELRDGEIDRLRSEKLALAVDLREALGKIAQLEEELTSLRRRRRRPPRVEPSPAPEAEDEPPSAGEQALADMQARLREHFHMEMEAAFLDRSHEQAQEAFRALEEAGYVSVLRRGPATVVRIPTRKLFQEGRSTLSARGLKIVEDAAAALSGIPGRQVAIEAHTHTTPTHSAEFASNWERGFGRAVAVLHALEASEVDARLSATSFAGTRPLAEGDTPQARQANRRVELVLTVDPDLSEPADPESEDEEGEEETGGSLGGEAASDDAASGQPASPERR